MQHAALEAQTGNHAANLELLLPVNSPRSVDVMFDHSRCASLNISQD